MASRQAADKLGIAVDRAKRARKDLVSVIGGTDSDEQSGSYENGTLSNVAPGLPITVQVAPAEPFESLSEADAAKLFHNQFAALAVQGWDVTLILGEDTDNPA
jgi:hypothetical protein